MTSMAYRIRLKALHSDFYTIGQHYSLYNFMMKEFSGTDMLVWRQGLYVNNNNDMKKLKDIARNDSIKVILAGMKTAYYR